MHSHDYISPFYIIAAIPGVLEKTHHALGDDVSTVRQGPSELPVSATPLPTCSITIDPLIAESLSIAMEELESSVSSLHVTIHVDQSGGTVEAAPTKLTKAKWERECQERLQDYVKAKYTKKEIQVPEEASSEINMLTHKQAQLAVSSRKTSLSAAGKIEAVGMFLNEVKAICSKYIQVKERETLDPRKYHFFTKHKLAEVKSKHPEVVIDENATDYTITLQGSAQSVANLQRVLPQYLAMTAVETHLSLPIIQYLQTTDGMQQLHQFMVKQRCNALTYYEQTAPSPNTLVLLCEPTQKSVTQRCSDVLKKELQAENYPFPESFVFQLPKLLQEYEDFCLQLEQQHHVQILTQSKSYSVAGFAKGVHSALKALQEYIQRKCTTETRFDIDRSKWRLLSGAMAPIWKGVIAQAQQTGAKIVLPADKALKAHIVLSGDILSVKEACEMIKKVLQSICRRSFPLSRPGTCRFFREEQIIVSGIETQHEVVIETREIDNSKVVDNEDIFTSFHKTCVARVNRMDIVLYIGDITEFDRADVIVNAANSKLSHVGGVAEAIAKKGGPVIQHESLQHVRREGELHEGDAWLSKQVGNLPFKAIIHAVGPRWRGGRANEEALLHKACYSSFKKAASKRYRSIAIPAIGSGIFQFPKDLCATTMIKAAVDFSAKDTCLQEVNFILYSPEDSATFTAALTREIPSATTIDDSKPLSATTFDDSKPLSSGPSFTPNPPPSHVMPMVHNDPPKAATKTPIELHKGSLLDIKVQLLVSGNVK